MATYVIAPGGNDGTGTGSAGNPWRTMNKLLSVIAAGDTGYCRGGSYTGNVLDVGQTGPAVGSAGSPVLIAAYPGDAAPVFDGTGAAITTQNFAIQLRAGSKYWTFRGLTWQNWQWWPARGANGSSVLNFDQTGGTQGDVSNILAEDCVLDMRGLSAPSTNDWVFYVGGACDYVTLRNSHIMGGGTTVPVQDWSDFGGGVQIFHAPGARHILIERNIIRFCRFGVNVDQPIAESGTDFAITHNTFASNNLHSLVQKGTNILVRDNAGDTPTGSSLLDEDTGGIGTLITNYTHDHNFAAQTFDGNWFLTSAGAKGAASDGTDAGAKNTTFGGRYRRKHLLLSKGG